MFVNRALSLLILCAVGYPAAAPAQNRQRNHAVRPRPGIGATWQKFHLWLNTAARASKADLVFAGDSITEDWRFAGKAVWQKYYGKRKALNLGISGDQTQHLLWRLGHGNLEGLSPRLVVLLIGVNNLYMPARDIAAGIRANVKLLRRKLPRARILLLGVFPCGEKPGFRRRKISRINKLAAAALPQGYSQLLPPLRAAYSHSASDGSRPPAQRQKARACFQSTQLTGWVPLPALPQLQYPSVLGFGHLPALTHAPNWATVTSVLLMRNAPTVTRCTGFSLLEPIMKLPPGMVTHWMPAWPAANPFCSLTATRAVLPGLT